MELLVNSEFRRNFLLLYLTNIIIVAGNCQLCFVLMCRLRLFEVDVTKRH